MYCNRNIKKDLWIILFETKKNCKKKEKIFFCRLKLDNRVDIPKMQNKLLSHFFEKIDLSRFVCLVLKSSKADYINFYYWKNREPDFTKKFIPKISFTIKKSRDFG